MVSVQRRKKRETAASKVMLFSIRAEFCSWTIIFKGRDDSEKEKKILSNLFFFFSSCSFQALLVKTFFTSDLFQTARQKKAELVVNFSLVQNEFPFKRYIKINRRWNRKLFRFRQSKRETVTVRIIDQLTTLILLNMQCSEPRQL